MALLFGENVDTPFSTLATSRVLYHQLDPGVLKVVDRGCTVNLVHGGS